MTEQERPGDPARERPRDPAPERVRFEGGRPSWLAVALGIGAGFAAAFVFPLVAMSLLDRLDGAQADVGMWVGMFGLPVLGLVALLVPAWRRAAAGFVMGLAIGAIVFGGVCITVLSSAGW